MNAVTKTSEQLSFETACKSCGKNIYTPHLKSHEEKCNIKEEKDTFNANENHSQSTIHQQPKHYEGDYSCKDCGLQFKYKKVLEKHVTVHKGRYPYWCKICMENFLTIEERTEHRLREHPQKKLNAYRCKLCKILDFANENEYLHHITELHKGREGEFYICSECGRDFKSNSELTQHNRSKCGTVKQFKCTLCGQELMTPGSLYTHMRRHSGERSFMCVYCGKQFVTLGQLQVHVRIHTQDKAFKCDVCGKGFCHRQSLITHSTIHTGVKPYQCENCCKSFSCVGNLLKHRRTHSDSCGLVPLTSHRVINPNTKLKLKINTPDSLKLKTFSKKKEIEERLSEYKKSLEQKPENIPDVQNLNDIKTTNELLDASSGDLQGIVKGECDVIRLKYECISDDNSKNESSINDTECASSMIRITRSKKRQFSEESVIQKNLVHKQDTSKAIKCKYCSKSYLNVRWLSKHEKQHESDTAIKSENCPYKCSCCKIGFITKEECKTHQENEHSDVLSRSCLKPGGGKACI